MLYHVVPAGSRGFYLNYPVPCGSRVLLVAFWRICRTVFTDRTSTTRAGLIFTDVKVGELIWQL